MCSVEDVLNLIKECWPKFVITKEQLLRPTQEVVVRFYSTFLDDYNEKIACLTGSPGTSDYNAVDSEPEERLCLQLSRFFRIHGLKFTLSDIYQPIYIRTKNFFRVCIHFVTFTEYVQSETETLVNTVFKTKEDATKLLLEQQALIAEINDNAQIKVELSENKCFQTLKSVKTSYKEMKAIKAAKEKVYTEKRSQIETFKRELQNEEHELERLENLEKNLTEQKITDKEYKNIVQTIESQKSESAMLDSEDIDIRDGLVHENEVLQHTANCISSLSNLDSNVEHVKKFIQQEDKLKMISNNIEKLTNTERIPLAQQKLENEQKLTFLKKQLINLQSKYKTVKDDCASGLIQISQQFNKFKTEVEDKYNSNCIIILQHQKDIASSEEELDKLRNAFTTQYVKVSKTEKIVVDKFKEILVKYKELY